MAEDLGSIIGNSVGEAAAFAAGIAIGPLLAPLLRALENETWSTYPDNPLNALNVASGVAEGKITQGVGAAEAALTGYSSTRFATLVDILQVAPAIPEALNLIRRGQMPASEFPTVLARAGLEKQWLAFYEAASNTALEPWEHPVSPADLALGLIRGNLENFTAPSGPAFPTGLSSAGSVVPHDPVLGLDVVKEAAASGVDADRMALLARNVGLPPGVIEGLQMLNRGIIDEASFGLLIEQSDARLSWGPFLLQLRRLLLSVHEYAELYLRGWIDQPTMYAGTALHGLTQEDSDLLVESIGRPLAVHQITTGLARGGTFGGFYEGVPSPYLEAIRESNIRPEWGNIAYANRYTYPGYFVIKPLVADGALTVAQATQIFENEGWPPDLAAAAAQSFAATGTGTTNKHVSSSITSLVTAARKAYVGGAANHDQTVAALDAAGVDAATQAQLFPVWDAQRTLEALPGP